MSGEVKIRLLADITDVERKIGRLDNSLKNIHMNVSTEQAEKSIRNVEKEINSLNRIDMPDRDTKTSHAGRGGSPSSAQKASNVYTSKFLKEIIKLLSLSSRLKSGKIEDMFRFLEKLQDVKVRYRQASGKPLSMAEQDWINVRPGLAKSLKPDKVKERETVKDNTPVKSEYHQKPSEKAEDTEQINRYLQDIIQMLSTGAKALSGREADVSKFNQQLMQIQQKSNEFNLRPDASLQRRLDDNSPEIQASIEQARAIKEEISRLRQDRSLMADPESKQAGIEKIESLLNQKKDIESNIREARTAEKVVKYSKQMMDSTSGSGSSSVVDTALGEVTDKVAGGLLRTLGKGILGEAGGAAAGAAGAAGSAAAGAGGAAATGAAGVGALAAGSLTMPIVGIALAAAAIIGKKVFKDVKEGSGKALSAEAREFQVLGKTNYYGSDMNRGRKDWYEVGKEYGYSAEDSLITADSYMKQSGYGGMENLKTDVKAIEGISKAYGLDPTQTANTAGALNKMGVFNDGEQRKFVNMLADAVQRNGMRGREDEQLEIMRNMADNLYATRLSVSQEDLMNSMNLQSQMVQANEAFKGEKGADTVSKLDSMVTDGNHTMDLLLGWGSELSGVEGYNELERRKELGFNDPENRERIIRNFERNTGRSIQADPEYFKAYLHANSGMSMQEIDALLDDPDFVKFLRSNEESLKELRELNKKIDENNTPKDISDIIDSYTGSNLAAEEKKITSKENLNQDAGNWGNNFTRWFKNTGAGFRDLISENIFETKTTFQNKSNSDKDISQLNLWNKHAIGKDYVPYDGYKAELHKGEAVLSQIEADNWRGAPRVSAMEQDKWYADAMTSMSKMPAQFKPVAQQKYQSDLLDKELKIVQERRELYKLQDSLLEIEAKQITGEEQLQQKDEFFDIPSLRKQQGIFDSIFGNNKLFDNIFGNVYRAASKDTSAQAKTNSLAEHDKAIYGNNAGLITAPNDLSVHTKLRRDHNVTAEQLNQIIEQSVAGSEKSSGRTSLLRGQGEAFIEASKSTGIHPIDILAQAAHESGWGTSKIAHDKKNFFGIGAFDASPYASAYSFGEGSDNGVGAGIVEGAKWIARNYVDKGQDSFYSMRWNNGVHEYATDEEYDKKLNNIRRSIYGKLPEETVSPKSMMDMELGAANIPKLAIGKDYIPYDGYKAELHKGEAILPKYLAEEWRSKREGINIAPVKRMFEDASPVPISMAESIQNYESDLPYHLLEYLDKNTNTSVTSTQNVNLNISGKIQGMDKNNQGLVASAIQQYYSPDKVNPNAKIMAMLENGSVRRQR